MMLRLLFGTMYPSSYRACWVVAEAFAMLNNEDERVGKALAVLRRAKANGPPPSNGGGGGPNKVFESPLLDASTAKVYTPGPYVSYGARQEEEYAKPTGWVRVNVADIPSDAECFGWSVGYHGTCSKALESILTQGLVAPADRGVESSHGQAGTSTETRGRTIYTSPCIGYSAHPVYTNLASAGNNTFTQIVLQVRVDQDKVDKRLGSTLGPQYWPETLPFAEGWSTDETLEWLTTDPSAVRVTGVMVRKLGADNNTSRTMFGDAASSFEYDEYGDEAKCSVLKPFCPTKPCSLPDDS